MMKRFGMLIDGTWCDAADGAVFETFNPATARPGPSFPMPPRTM
jgi:acyl-CoA reductase-like NAD-dependent aldehyde dehydrogenase